MKNWDVTRTKILSIPVPDNTQTYTAIPHSVFLDELSEKLYNKGYKIQSESFLGAMNYQILTGKLGLARIEKSEDEDVDTLGVSPAIYFTNSYNKMKRASIKAGAMVLVCKNGMIGMSVSASYTRKHKGTALEDFRNHASLVIDNIEADFQKLKQNVREMKEITLSKKTIATLVGDMIVNEQMITATQISILNKEINYSTKFTQNTLWDFYNHCTESFKESHPSYYEKQHLKLHAYLSDKFTLSGARGLYNEPLDLTEEAQVVGG
jgi:hypothetical protein